MKRIVIIVSIAFQTTLLAQGDSVGHANEAPDFDKMSGKVIGRKFGLFQTPQHDSSQIRKLIQNKVIFINFWFASCLPCLAEVKGLNKLYDTLKNNLSFTFLSITYESPQVISAFRKKHKIKYQIFSIPKQKIKELNYYGRYPINIVLDPDRTIKYFHIGALIGQDDNDTEEANKAFIFENFYPAILKELKNCCAQH